MKIKFHTDKADVTVIDEKDYEHLFLYYFVKVMYILLPFYNCLIVSAMIFNYDFFYCWAALILLQTYLLYALLAEAIEYADSISAEV